MGLNFIAYSKDIYDLFMANQPHEMSTFPRVEGHEMPCLPHDFSWEFTFQHYFIGLSLVVLYYCSGNQQSPPEYEYICKGQFMHMYCIASKCKIIINSQLLVTRRKNARQRNTRIWSQSILAFHSIAVSANVSTTQHNTGPCVIQ